MVGDEKWILCSNNQLKQSGNNQMKVPNYIKMLACFQWMYYFMSGGIAGVMFSSSFFTGWKFYNRQVLRAIHQIESGNLEKYPIFTYQNASSITTRLNLMSLGKNKEVQIKYSLASTLGSHRKLCYYFLSGEIHNFYGKGIQKLVNVEKQSWKNIEAV